ncbi:metal-dependent phosphohydrolase HD sub domain containing protein [Clostridium sp. DL-VIII]|uniref:HD domain-containing protein n=1 Tax=Clostridium sp. DL-VIII TaxID=641107 RepID=UPI00023AFD90|nr:HD domain-containing protein [Clostridium sp. DL-VIII]EHI99631.1 metal-dependent phosphohydrolase HD sub domain containing protein [Clostridium sp. DL-VIII]
MQYCYEKEDIPSLEEAKMLLKEAEDLNPGPWVMHSMYVAEGAKLTAEQTENLNPEVAYVLGMLHDIGRREGVHAMRHGLDGYRYAISNGYELVARICLSHTAFKYNKEVVVVGRWDGTIEEYNFVKDYLSRTEETEYDKLIKLCDYLALPSGFVLIEKRIVDIALRGGVNEYTIPRWESIFEIKSYFEEKIGKSIYSLLPNVKENTFGL